MLVYFFWFPWNFVYVYVLCCSPINIRYGNYFLPFSLSHIHLSRYRFSNKAVVFPAANSSSSPIYVPAQTECALSLWNPYNWRKMVSDVFIVFSSCIVERTCGALMVWSQSFSCTGMIRWYINSSILSSTRIWSWSLLGWQSRQIFNTEPLHLLSF